MPFEAVDVPCWIVSRSDLNVVLFVGVAVGVDEAEPELLLNGCRLSAF